MAEKKKGKLGTQSGKAEDVDARIEKLKEKDSEKRPFFQKNRKYYLELDRLQQKKGGFPRMHNKKTLDKYIAERDKEVEEMKAGGSVKAKKKTTRKFRGDGIARKGKTKGRFV